MRLLIALCPLLLGLAACGVETEFTVGEAVELRFERDTVSFDTVFTARGSATRVLKVYNDGADPVRIDRISVEGRTGVTFTFNVDGFMGPAAEDVVIWGNDSIFVFVEAEVDPTSPEEISPFIAEDRLVFETGTRRHDVVLQAFGQNAFYLNGFNRGTFVGISRMNCSGGTVQLPVDLPTVVYGSLFIDSCVVQALAGTRIYFHGGVQRNAAVGGSGIFNDGFIYTQANGSLQLLGTRDNPVVLATDRLEPEFRTSPAKYRGLIFGPGSGNNILRHTRIYNAIAGVTADSLSTVTIEDSEIAHSGGPAISAYQATVTARNSLFHSNFGNTVQFVKGGSLVLEHCTLANYGVDQQALVLVNFDCDDAGNCIASPLTARVRNSIIAGSMRSELILLDGFTGSEPGFYDVRIRNSVVRTDAEFLGSNGSLLEDFYTDECQGCYNFQPGDPLFVSIDQDDYRLDSLSVARDLGVFLPDLPTDLRGSDRDTDRPDAGAIEWVPGG